MDNSTSTEAYSTQNFLISAPEFDKLEAGEDADIRPQMPQDVYACGVVFLCMALLPEDEKKRIHSLDIQKQAREIVSKFKSASPNQSRVPIFEPS